MRSESIFQVNGHGFAPLMRCAFLGVKYNQLDGKYSASTSSSPKFGLLTLSLVCYAVPNMRIWGNGQTFTLPTRIFTLDHLFFCLDNSLKEASLRYWRLYNLQAKDVSKNRP